MTFRFRSLFAAAYSHGGAAATDAPLHTAFSAHFDIFFYRGVAANIYFSVSVVLFIYFLFPSVFIDDALILWPRL